MIPRRKAQRDVPVRRIQLVITGFEDGGRDSQVKNYLEPRKSRTQSHSLRPSGEWHGQPCDTLVLASEIQINLQIPENCE